MCGSLRRIRPVGVGRLGCSVHVASARHRAFPLSHAFIPASRGPVFAFSTPVQVVSLFRHPRFLSPFHSHDSRLPRPNLHISLVVDPWPLGVRLALRRAMNSYCVLRLPKAWEWLMPVVNERSVVVRIYSRAPSRESFQRVVVCAQSLSTIPCGTSILHVLVL